MKDQKQPRQMKLTEYQDSIEETEEKLVMVDTMAQRLENLVDLSFRGAEVLKLQDRDKQNHYLRVFGLLQTLKGLQERYSIQVATGQKQIDDPEKRIIS